MHLHIFHTGVILLYDISMCDFSTCTMIIYHLNSTYNVIQYTMTQYNLRCNIFWINHQQIFFIRRIYLSKNFSSLAYQNSLINHASRNAGITNPPIDAIANSKQNIWLDDREKEGFKHHPIPLLVSKTFSQWIRGHNVFCNWV